MTNTIESSIPGTKCYFDQIPDELVLFVTRYLHGVNKFQFSWTCKRFWQIFLHNHKDFPKISKILKLLRFGTSETVYSKAGIHKGAFINTYGPDPYFMVSKNKSSDLSNCFCYSGKNSLEIKEKDFDCSVIYSGQLDETHFFQTLGSQVLFFNPSISKSLSCGQHQLVKVIPLQKNQLFAATSVGISKWQFDQIDKPLIEAQLADGWSSIIHTAFITKKFALVFIRETVYAKKAAFNGCKVFDINTFQLIGETLIDGVVNQATLYKNYVCVRTKVNTLIFQLQDKGELAFQRSIPGDIKFFKNESPIMLTMASSAPMHVVDIPTGNTLLTINNLHNSQKFRNFENLVISWQTQTKTTFFVGHTLLDYSVKIRELSLTVQFEEISDIFLRTTSDDELELFLMLIQREYAETCFAHEITTLTIKKISLPPNSQAMKKEKNEMS